MANTFEFDIPADIKNRYPENISALLPTYFRFSMARLPNTTYFCQTASIPSVTLTDVSMPNPFVPIKAPSKMEFDDLTITFIVDEALLNWLEIYNWMRSVTNVENYEEFRSANTHLTTANLVVLNSGKQPKINVTFEGLYPKNLSAIDFSSTIMDPEPIQSTVTFGYRSYSIERY